MRQAGIRVQELRRHDAAAPAADADLEILRSERGDRIPFLINHLGVHHHQFDARLEGLGGWILRGDGRRAGEGHQNAGRPRRRESLLVHTGPFGGYPPLVL